MELCVKNINMVLIITIEIQSFKPLHKAEVPAADVQFSTAIRQNSIHVYSQIIDAIGIPSQCLTCETDWCPIRTWFVWQQKPVNEDIVCFTDNEKETDCVDAQNLLSFYTPRRDVFLEPWHFRTRTNILSPENPTVRSHSQLLLFLPQFSPHRRAAEFVLDDKPDHKGELCGFWLSERVVCVLRYGLDYHVICQTQTLSETLILLVTQYETEIRCGRLLLLYKIYDILCYI